MPLYGKLSDQYGRKPLLYAAIIIFLTGSALCGLAQNMVELIVFRAIQGLGAGGFLPLAQIVIGDLIPPAERGKRQGSIAAVYATTSVLGPVLGGTEWPWDGGEVKYLSALAAVLTAALLWHVRRVPEPVLPPDLFQNRVFNVASVVLALTFVGMMGSSVFFPLLFQMVMGASPANSGLLTVPMMVGLVISSSLNGHVLARSGGRYKPAQLLGLSLATASFGVLALGIAGSAGYLVMEPAMFVLGAGLGLVMPNMTMAVQNALPASRRGVGTAMRAFFRSLGGLVGVTGSGAILAHQLHGQAATAQVYRHAIGNIFGAGTLLVGLGLLVLLLLPELPMAPHPAAGK